MKNLIETLIFKLENKESISIKMISDKLKNLILKELNLQEFEFSEETLAKDVPGWDSLKNFTIILSIEEEFGIKFLTEEILSIKNVGDLQKLIDLKVNQN